MKSRKWAFVFVVALFAALAIPAQATVVFTPVNMTLPTNGYYAIDLNLDGITDFTLRTISFDGRCPGLGGGPFKALTVQPGSAGGIVGTSNAAALLSGVLIDFRQNFFRETALMYEVMGGTQCPYSRGNWGSASQSYLGLEFQINGQTHYGWAELTTNGRTGVDTLYGFAYETIPGRAIKTGQTMDSPEGPAMDSGPAESKVRRPSAPVAVPTSHSPQLQASRDTGPAAIATQDNPSQDQKSKHRKYKLIDVGTFGGPASYINNPFALGAPNQINSSGTTVGAAATPIPSPGNSNTSICEGIDGNTPFVFHAFKWENGVVTDLGSLPGPDNCSVATSVNEDGEITGYSENGLTDPLTGIREIRAVRWKDGQIKDLGTFGGNHSLVANINDRGQIFGDAMNAVPDPYSLYYNLLGFNTGTQTRAFVWQNGQKQDLGTLGGPDAAAFFGNDRGQVVGGSYTNSIPNPTTGIPTLDPFLWERGTMIDLGTLGGTNGTAFLLNNQGQVVGYSNLAGDQTSHPFLWQRGQLTDLFTTTVGGSPITANQINDDGEIVGGGAFPGQTFDAYLWRNGAATDLGRLTGDCTSEGVALNSDHQVIGYSLSCGSSHRAVLWENGSMIDLNTVIPGDSGLTLKETLAINDRGQIAGDAAPTGCLNYAACGHAYILIPCDDKHPGECDDDSMMEVTAPQSSAPRVEYPLTVNQDNGIPISPLDRVRNMMRQRFHVPGQPAASRE